MTDTQDADAGGRWRIVPRPNGSYDVSDGLQKKRTFFNLTTHADAAKLRNYLNAAETARREAEAALAEERREHQNEREAHLRTARSQEQWHARAEKAEQERDRLQGVIAGLSMDVASAGIDTARAEARAAAAEADATWQKTANEALTTAGNAMKKRLEAEAAALREKAALADNHASHLRTRRKIAAGISNLSISEDYWLARYDALGPTHESEDER